MQPNKTRAWQALASHYDALKDVHMRELFARDPQRFERFSLRFEDILLDYAKNRITAETLELLLDLARECDVEGWRARMFGGEKINVTEKRAVLHVALRAPRDQAICVDGELPRLYVMLLICVMDKPIRQGRRRKRGLCQREGDLHLGRRGELPD